MSEIKVPEGWKLVPVEPTEEMWGGLARDLMMWLDFDNKTVEALRRHLAMLNVEWPKWMDDEDELKGSGVPSKGTRATLIYKAMLAAAPAAPVADGTTSDEYRAELYDEVWQRARGMGYGNVTDALVELERLKAAAPVVQAEQEPVAWDVLYSDDDCLAHAVRTKKEADHYSGMAYYVKPLYYAAPPAHPGAPRCQCCGYLVTESEHRGCLRSSSPPPDAALVEALRNMLAAFDNPIARRKLGSEFSQQAIESARDALAGKGGAQ